MWKTGKCLKCKAYIQERKKYEEAYDGEHIISAEGAEKYLGQVL